MLFLVLLDYLRPLPEVDVLQAGHREFLARHYAAGHFLLSGRKVPRTGGVILARGDSRAEVARWLAEDPFHQTGVAAYEIVAWEPVLKSAEAPSGWPGEVPSWPAPNLSGPS